MIRNSYTQVIARMRDISSARIERVKNISWKCQEYYICRLNTWGVKFRATNFEKEDTISAYADHLHPESAPHRFKTFFYIRQSFLKKNKTKTAKLLFLSHFALNN